MASDAALIAVPLSLTASALYGCGGAIRLPGLLSETALAALDADAAAARLTGQRNVLLAAGGGGALEERGGNPDRAFTSAQGSAVQWAIFSAPGLVAAVEHACGLCATPTGGGSYSYYERPDDHLALHRDIVQCDLTVITCLQATPASGAGGVLLVYPDCMGCPIGDAWRAGRAAASAVSLRRGDSVALLGGVVPHEVTAMARGQERIVSVMCYRVIVDGHPLS